MTDSLRLADQLPAQLQNRDCAWWTLGFSFIEFLPIACPVKFRPAPGIAIIKACPNPTGKQTSFLTKT